MDKHVCPVWVGYFLASGLRKLLQNPAKIVGPFIEPGLGPEVMRGRRPGS